MNKYCYKIVSEDGYDIDAIKKHVEKLYRLKKHGENAFGAELPFMVIQGENDQVCINMTSRAKANINKVEAIHKKLTAVNLKIDNDTYLTPPVQVKLEQCAWWDDDCKLKSDVKWTTLIHNGPYFTHIMEPYKPHGAPLIYDGKSYKLSPKEERAANFYAQRLISEEAGTVTTILTKDKVFNDNFWRDFKKYLTPDHKKIFKDFKKIKFTKIVNKLKELKEEKKTQTKAEKEATKIKNLEKKEKYGYVYVNGVKEPLGAYTVEPASLFMGRGAHPKRGSIKRDIEPEEVTINVSKGHVPDPPPGHNWAGVIHDNTVAWIASWNNPIDGKSKHVYASAEGQQKGKSDMLKYEVARKLNNHLVEIRAKYLKDLKSGDKKIRQLATVLYLIDNYGIRAGGEKDESEADTVGASTLRVEHIKLRDPDTVIFDFLGKDSIPYYKEITVSPEIYQNMVEFTRGKLASAQLFDRITAADINAYLQTFDGDFKAKVFRTRLGSTLMDSELKKLKVKKSATNDEKKKLFLKANIEVAKLLNHQRTVSKKAKESIKKNEAELRDLKKKLKEVKESGKSTKALETRIKKKKDQIDTKKKTLDNSPTTSLTNYIDPRIVVSWIKRNNVPVPKIYTATLQKKFKWAIDNTDADWDYTDTPVVAELKKLEPKTVLRRPGITAPVAKPPVKAVKKPVAKPPVKAVKKPVAKPSVKAVPKPPVKAVPKIKAVSKGETIEDILKDSGLTENEIKVVKHLHSLPNFTDFIEDEIKMDSNIYRDVYLQKFLECIDIDASEMSRDTIVKGITAIMEPDSVQAYLFITYILKQLSPRVRKEYISVLRLASGFDA